MGHSDSTHTRTHMKPVPVLMGMGTAQRGYGYWRVTQVLEPAQVGMTGLCQYQPLMLLPVSAP